MLERSMLTIGHDVGVTLALLLPESDIPLVQPQQLPQKCLPNRWLETWLKKYQEGAVE
jgi:hypothetical protein